MFKSLDIQFPAGLKLKTGINSIKIKLFSNLQIKINHFVVKVVANYL